MSDYPDWTRLFYLTGTDIVIPISIDAATVTLPVSIDAATVTIDVALVASDVTLPVSIDAATVTLDVNLTAATATIDINFSDQSVAVFDAAKWFAHNAQQQFIIGSGSVPNNGSVSSASRTIPAGKVMFVTGMAYNLECSTATPRSSGLILDVDGVRYGVYGSIAGGGLVFDTPLRLTAGQLARLYVHQWGSGAAIYCTGGFWGYDEDA